MSKKILNQNVTVGDIDEIQNPEIQDISPAGAIPLHPFPKVFQHLSGWYSDILSKLSITYWSEGNMPTSGHDFTLFIQLENIYAGFGNFDSLNVKFIPTSICELKEPTQDTILIPKLCDTENHYLNKKVINFKLKALNPDRDNLDKYIGTLEVMGNFETIPLINIKQVINIKVWSVPHVPPRSA